MKKKAALLLGLIVMASGVLAGCGGSEDRVATEETTTQAAAQEKTTAQGGDKGTAQNVKLGVGMTARVADSKEAGEEDGVLQADVTVASVTVDENGKIVSCAIDEVSAKVNFDDDGHITTDINGEISTKQELGESYGMKAASSIQKEWNEQADAFAQYCVGKTAEEVKNMSVTEDGKASDADLASSCTIYVANFIDTVVKAVNNAK